MNNLFLRVTEQLSSDKDEVLTFDHSTIAYVQIAPDNDYDEGLYVQIRSSDSTGKHSELRKLLGKKVKVTVEVVG